MRGDYPRFAIFAELSPAERALAALVATDGGPFTIRRACRRARMRPKKAAPKKAPKKSAKRKS